jgi:putative SOS response-associated peptidase YedK
MCNHYSGDEEGLVEFVRKTAPWIRIPAPFCEAAVHMYPKRKGRVVREKNGEAELVLMRWGVWPFYQKDNPKLVSNARNDGLISKAIWKQSARHRRCLVPATGYFEPGLGPVGARGEVRFTVRERPHFYMAGLWDNDPNGSGECGYTLVTTEPNDYVRPFHDRMPVVLSDTDALAWLGEEPLPDARLIDLCRGLPSEALLHEEIAAKAPEKLTVKRPDKKLPSTPEQPTLF